MNYYNLYNDARKKIDETIDVMRTLSVIIPVYNTSAYIMRCLQSVEAQTLHDFEVILVDDHGQDDSISVATGFAAKSKRKDIHYVFTQTPINSGPAVARNLGMQQAKGEYIAFLDADDWIEPEMYDALYTNAKSCAADLSCCNMIQDFEDRRPNKVLKNPVIGNGLITVAGKKYFLTTFVSYFTTFAYRREWLIENQIQFANSKSSEDSSFLACCILAAERMAQTDQSFYHYIIHSGSLTQRKVWKGREKRRAFAALFAFARSRGLMSTYWLQLFYVYAKKAILVPVVEMIK